MTEYLNCITFLRACGRAYQQNCSVYIKINRTISEGSMPWGAATAEPASETRRGRRTSLDNIVGSLKGNEKNEKKLKGNKKKETARVNMNANVK
jgi:hypothetical protein